MSLPFAARAVVVGLSFATAILSQQPEATQKPDAPTNAPPRPARGDEAARLAWPRDAKRVIATVAGDDVTLTDLVDHLQERHDPSLRALLETDAGARLLRSAVFTRFVRQYADVVALRRTARDREVDPQQIEASLSAALGRGFASWLDAYRAQRRQQGIHEDPPETTVQKLMTRFQSEFGLEWERQGWLDALVPIEVNEDALQAYYTANARVFGGHVTFAHILIHHRDPMTGELLTGDAKKAAAERIADVKSRLKADGSNFEEVARAMSEDRKSAPQGGVFRDVARFDPRLPAELTRTAWGLADDAFTGPVETQYGMHFVKRISYVQTTFLLLTEDAKPRIRERMQIHRQEDLLLDLRRRLPITLLY